VPPHWTHLISAEVTTLLDLLEDGRTQEAEARLAGLRRQLLPKRKAISRLMAGLFALEDEFVKRSRAV